MIDFLSGEKKIILTYHYVENKRSDRAGIHPCGVAEFDKHIAFLAKHFCLASVDEVFKAATERAPGRFCAITFDDGLKGQYTNAAPILKKYGAHAIFFIISSTFDGKMPLTHKLHLLLSLCSSKEIVLKYHAFLDAKFPGNSAYRVPLDMYTNSMRKRDDIYTANIKDAFAATPRAVCEAFLARFFEEEGLDERKLSQEFFLTRDDVAAMAAEKNFEIGCHTHFHRAFEWQHENEIEEELARSQNILHECIGKRPRVLSYPYGRIGVAREKTIHLLEKHGFSYAVTTEKRALLPTEFPLFLPRYNANDLSDYLAVH
ncbi:MAG: polysaccharide deacetylase family protein [Parcubacteria group bacterium]|nr:polysaccharide deacetylase family protein [Parcubacteria group bacterium]